MAQAVPPRQQVSGVPPATPTLFPSTSLYVGDLDPSVSESQLYDAFNQVGPVVSIRVCRDSVTKKSLGYAYVNYKIAEDASRAIEMLNFAPICGKPIRIMHSHRDPSIRKSGNGNIFIKNLDKTIDHKSLYDTFSVFGPILSCKVATDESGNSKGFGFVQFDQEEAAQNAIEKVNGMLINDKQVFVGPFVRQQERGCTSSSSKFKNVYVKNLAETTTDEELLEIFGEYGPITSAVVMRDTDGRSKCFGFVNFENANDASKAVDALNGRKVNDKELYVGRAQKRSERETELKNKFDYPIKEGADKQQGSNLYLKNLDDSIDDEKLRELFSAFGIITSCKVMRDPNGQSKGSGFVAFSSSEAADLAVRVMNGKMIGSKPLYVALAQKKEERRAKLEAQFARIQSGAAVGSTLTPNSTFYHTGTSGLGQQVFYKQPLPSLMASQAGFGFQLPMIPGIRHAVGQPSNYHVPIIQRPNQPVGQPSNYHVPIIQRPNQQTQQWNPERKGSASPFQAQQPPLEHQVPLRGIRGYPYSQIVQNTSDSTLQCLGSLELGRAHINRMEMPVSARTSGLAFTSREQHRAILGEQLYPLVEQLEHEHTGKVTGMLLEMDQSEVLHLIDSPEALKVKVAEAMEILRMAHATVTESPIEQLAALSLST